MNHKLTITDKHLRYARNRLPANAAARHEAIADLRFMHTNRNYLNYLESKDLSRNP